MNKLCGKNLVVKSNHLIEASYKLTTQEQRVILLMASMIKPEDTDFHVYRIRVDDFMKTLGIRGHSRHKELKQITKKLRERTLIIKDMVADTELQIGWLSSVKYFNRKGYVQLRFDPELKPYLLKLKEYFTSYQLRNVVRLRSAYSIRIYELLKQYEKIGKRTFKLEELKKILGIGKDEYRLYGHFKSKILMMAHEELYRETDLSFEFTEKKKGRKVTAITFMIRMNRADKEPQIPEIPNPELYRRLQEYFCLTSGQAKKILLSFDEDYILGNLAYVEEKIKAGGVKNPGAYTLKAMKEDYRNRVSRFDAERQETETAVGREAVERDIWRDYNLFMIKELEKYSKTLPDEELQRISDTEWEKLKKEHGKKRHLRILLKPSVNEYLREEAGLPTFEEWREKEMGKYPVFQVSIDK